jgi:hypothetical protein
MNDLERYHACMNYKSVDRVPTWFWGPWPETVERWKNEGYDPVKFDLKMGLDTWQVPYDWFFPIPPFSKEIVEENEHWILYVNHEGILLREQKVNPASSMPQFVKFPVENRKEFRKFWNERMRPDLSQRLGPDWKSRLKTMRTQPHPFILNGDRWTGFFGPLRNLVGVERLCELFYDDPAFVEEMMDAEVEYIIGITGQILDVISIDAFVMWEDMAYNHGPLISPHLVRTYMLPRYKKVTEFLRKRGVEFIGLDCDGQMDSLIPVWLEAGLNFLYPFEVQAGMDVLAVRKKYGRILRIWGGIDKRALANGPEAIQKELNRIRPLIEEGGYVPHTDHSIPPDVSFKDFLYYREKLKDVLQAR